MPDLFTLEIVIEEEASDAQSALQAMAAVQARVSGGMKSMVGLDQVRLSTEPSLISPARDPACARSYVDAECEIVGYRGRMPMTLTASPAESAGDAMSLAMQLGAHAVSIEGFDIRDKRGLTLQANRAAFEDAQRQAQALAEASGHKIVRTLRVSDANLRYGEAFGLVAPGEATAAAQFTPVTPLPVDPAPVQVQSSVSVLFEIE